MKRFLSILGVLALVTAAHYIYRQWPKATGLEVEVEKAGVVWPVGTDFEMDDEGNLIFILKESLKFREGHWPEGTQIHFKEDKIVGVETFDQFEFAQFNFFQAAKIAFLEENEKPVHIIELTDKAEFDGLPLKAGCLIKFVNYVLEKANCPEFENVYFKRKISLPKVESEPNES